MPKKWLLPLALTGLLSSCGPTSPSLAPLAKPSATPGFVSDGSLSNLVPNSVISKEELELRDILKRPLELKFPVRVGILLFQYRTPLKDEDQQNQLESLFQSVKGSDLIKEVIQIPSSLVQGGATIETIRQLGARFQVDVVLIVSGTHAFQKADQQPLSFFETFTDRAWYESRATLEAFALNIFSGTFLGSFRAVGHEGPALFDPTTETFKSASYELQKKAVDTAIEQLKTEFLAKLRETRQTLAEQPAPTPTPANSPAPTVSPSPSPTPSPTPTPAV